MLLRLLALGAASGLRSTAAPTAVYARRGWPVLPIMALGELIVDKLPMAPPRTQPGALAARAFAAAAAARALAERSGDDARLAAAVAIPAALGSAVLGRRYRGAVADRGWPDLPAALLEDAVAYGLAFGAANASQDD